MQVLDKSLTLEWQKLMDEGYQHSRNGDHQAAADVWIKLWKQFVATMKLSNLEYIEDLRQASGMSDHIFNWAMDFDVELSDAASENKSYYHEKIAFCKQYIALSGDKNELNVLVLKRELAESHFMIGETAEGERLFREYVKSHPTSAYGWINWSDQYGTFGIKENQDFENAVQILKQGLEVEGLDEEIDAMDRLVGLYREMGLTQEAEEMKQRIREKSRENSRVWIEPFPSFQKEKPMKVEKVGRNDPCTCGSGKKFKKCCG